MLAASAVRIDADDPLSGLEVGERPDPEPGEGWTTVRLRAASLNHHDLWSLQGVGLPADRLPMILGCDGAGVAEDGTEVVVHAVISDPDHRGDETLDPKRSLLSERYDGPCPPSGTHHYHFTVYALRTPTDLDDGVDTSRALDAIASEAVARGTLVGTVAAS